jgi:hypothetical protein
MTEEQKAARRERQRIRKAKQRAADPSRHRAANRRYAAKHKDRVRRQQRENYLANQESRLAYAREQRQRMRAAPESEKARIREETRLRMAQWRAENREHALEQGRLYARRYYRRNKKKCYAQSKRWRANNLERANAQARASCLRFRRNNPAKYLWHCARGRAKKFGIPFDLQPSDIVVPERCPVLGVLMKQLTGPNTPTIDRIRPSLGYVKGNVAVICRRANAIKNDCVSPAEIRKVADWLETQLNDGV